MIDNLTNIFGFIGALGMFLYGMSIMADGMQKSAGGKMQQFLGMITANKFTAIGLGALITAIIQSSGATTVMVVGFVNAGIINLTQAVGVIMGANIGTTITAWIVSINQIGSALEISKPEFYAPLILGVGVILLLFTKSQKKKIIGEILIGVGFLFLGLKFMSLYMKPYTQLPIFRQAFIVLGGNPFLGIVVGCFVTAILQSSSASVGILQTLALSGVVTKNAAIYVTLGQNIGSCVTALISCAGSSKTAKRAAIIHLSFNVIGSVLFGILAFVYFSINKAFANSNITSVEISIFHTFFNITNTLILLPFSGYLVKLSGMIIKEDDKNVVEENEENEVLAVKHLDKRMFESPSFALEAGKIEVVRMGNLTLKSLQYSIDAINTRDKEKLSYVFEKEKTINKLQSVLTEYLLKVDNLSISEHQKLVLNHLYYSVNDIERIADHIENIAENIVTLNETKTHFSDTALNDLNNICKLAYKSAESAIKAIETSNMNYVIEVNKFEDEVDELEVELREKHIDRLVSGKCNPQAGIIFLDIVSNIERISDHATNLAGYIQTEA